MENKEFAKTFLRNKKVLAGIISILVGAAATAGYHVSPEFQDLLTQMLTLFVNMS